MFRRWLPAGDIYFLLLSNISVSLSGRLFIKHHLLWSFASLLLFSPLNCSLREGLTFMFFHVQPLGQPFPALWGWHLNLHENLYSASLPAPLLSSALARDGSILELSGTGSTSHKGTSWQLLLEAMPVTCPTTKPCHKTQYIPFLLFSISGMHPFWIPLVYIDIQKWLS